MTADEVRNILDRLEDAVKRAKSIPIEAGQWSMDSAGAAQFYGGSCFVRIGDFHITDESKSPKSPLWLLDLHDSLHMAIYSAEKP